MNKNPKIKESKEDKGFKIMTQAEHELNATEWFGAIIRYSWYLGRKKFDTFYDAKQLKKNAQIGWFFQILVILIIIYLSYKYIISP